MGWGRYFLLGNLGQQLDLSDHEAEIQQLRNELRRVRGSAPDADSRIRRLELDVDEMRLYLAAIFRLLLSKGILTKDEVKQCVEAIDLEDGSADGKYRGNVC
jgi:hypothetical protein